MAGAVAALALFFVLSWVPGWAAARAARLRTDDLGRFWIGCVITSVVGLLLAQYGWFSLTALAAIVALVATGCLAALPRAGAVPSPLRDADRWVPRIAAVAVIAVFLWSWPPFETVIAASDSTMYLNAGVHLARTGSLTVAETVTALLAPADAQAIFASVGWHGSGPFVRLPGGLLVPALTEGTATPAFFPLLPVWVAIATAAGGVATAPIVAPVFSALAVASVTVFAGETLGIAAAAFTAVTLVANFAVWWFAKFPMPEPLAAAAVWSGLVFLHRASGDGDRRGALLAGAVLGTGGLARTETFLFLIAAGALTWSWRRMRAPLVPALIGFAVLGALAVVTVEQSPSHHLAYLRNELGLQYVAMYPRLLALRRSNATVMVAVLGVVGLLAAGLVGRRSGAGFVRGVLRVAVPLGVAAVLAVYVRLGGVLVPSRQVSWIAAYCSWPMLVLAAIGAPLVWRRGGEITRMAVVIWIVATLVFVANPRVAAYQPWAIRRFLPIVIPGIAVAASAALAWIAMRPRRGAAAAAVAVALVIVALELGPVLVVRARNYYAGSFALVRGVADRVPQDAIVAMDSDFADVQVQVPLWMIHGRETLMLGQTGQRWRDVMRALVATGRPVFWIGNRYGAPLSTGDITLTALEPDPELIAITPDAPGDAPPSRTVRRVIPFRIYGVGLAVGRIN